MIIDKIVLKWEKLIDAGTPTIIIKEVPARVMKRLAKKYNLEIREEGVVQFMTIDFETFVVKLVRPRKRSWVK